MELRKDPVLFFHSPTPVTVRMRIDFPGGMPGMWWPGTIAPAARGMRRPAVGDSLEWLLGVKAPPPGRQPRHPAPHPLPDGDPFKALRAVKCDEVFAVYGDQALDVDREKFVFYDGLFPHGKWLHITVGKDGVALASRVKHAVFDVTVIDRRAPGKVRVGRVARIDAGGAVAAVEMREEEASGFARRASDTLTKQLVAAGLLEDEAATLLSQWRKELFEEAGLHVFYRIPQEEYERRLPLTLTPRAESLVRVGLVHHGHVEPDLAERVLALARRLDDDDFEVREAAEKQLQALGRAAYVHLARLRSADLPVEARRRVGRLLEQWDARAAIPK
jgi:hypothetical protein